MKFTLKHLLIFITFVSLYIATWTEGTKHYRAKLERNSQSAYEKYTRSVEETNASLRREGMPDRSLICIAGEPRVHVENSFPILPGVLIVDSGVTYKRLTSRGGWKIVLYYGFGTAEFGISEWVM